MNSEPTKTMEPGMALGEIAREFLRLGFIAFGGPAAHIALMEEQFVLVVRLHWLTEAQLLDAIAISQATPGPFFTVATFIGYVLGGWRGALFATAGMFLPAFLFVAATANFLPRLRQSRAASAFLDGVNAAAVALMGWQFARVTLASVVLVFWCRVDSAWVMAGGAVAGAVFRLAHRS